MKLRDFTSELDFLIDPWWSCLRLYICYFIVSPKNDWQFLDECLKFLFWILLRCKLKKIFLWQFNVREAFLESLLTLCRFPLILRFRGAFDVSSLNRKWKENIKQVCNTSSDMFCARPSQKDNVLYIYNLSVLVRANAQKPFQKDFWDPKWTRGVRPSLLTHNL